MEFEIFYLNFSFFHSNNISRSRFIFPLQVQSGEIKAVIANFFFKFISVEQKPVTTKNGQLCSIT